MQNVLDYMKENFSVINSLKNVTDKFFISTATLNRWFAKYIKLSPKKYLENLKLQNAKKLLLLGNSVTEACFNSGFNDCSYFICLFKARFNVTPYKYKKSL